MNLYQQRLSGGKRGSLGEASEVLQDCLQQPTILSELWSGVLTDDAVLRSRCAWVIRHLGVQQPHLVQPFCQAIIKQMAIEQQWEVREQLCMVITALKLSAKQQKQVVTNLQPYLQDKSSIVKTCVLQAMSDLVLQDTRLKLTVLEVLHQVGSNGTPAMRARTRKLLKLPHLQ